MKTSYTGPLETPEHAQTAVEDLKGVLGEETAIEHENIVRKVMADLLEYAKKQPDFGQNGEALKLSDGSELFWTEEYFIINVNGRQNPVIRKVADLAGVMA